MEGTITAGADLMSSVPADLFTAPDVEGIVNESGAEETAPEIDAPESVEEPIEEPSTEEAPETEEEAPAEEEEQPEVPQQPAPADEDLPEGVRRGKDRNGKEGVWVEKSRWENTLHPHHKVFQQASEMLGEPLTMEAIDLRNRAYMGQERLYNDLLSSDPNAQAKLLKHFFDEAKRSRDEGEIGHDPMVSLGETFYNTLRDKSPDGYARVRLQAAKDLISEMYQDAASRGDKNLWLSAGHFAKTLGLSYHKADEMESFVANQNDPVAMLRAENDSLKSQLNGRQSTNQAAQFDQWNANTRQNTTTAVTSEAIMPALADAQKAWEKFPEAFQDLVVNRLHSAVQRTIAADKNFNDRINLLAESAKRAASAQKRNEIAADIQQAYVRRAHLAVEAHKGKILSDAARLYKERNDANHARRQAAQGQRGPTGPASPVPKSIIPDLPSRAGTTFNVKDAMSDMKRLFGS